MRKGQEVKKRYTTQQFIDKASMIHNDKYSYSKTIYEKYNIKIIITCPAHGDFEQKPQDHLTGRGCKACRTVAISRSRIGSTLSFITKASKIHNNRYNYSLAKYTYCNTKVKIICNIHGLFEQSPQYHYLGFGCPKCTASKGEIRVMDVLDNNNIKYTIQEYFKDSPAKCINNNTNRPLPFDFYLPAYNLCIEFDGIQHFKPHSFNHKHKSNKEENLRMVKDRDIIKTQYCLDNNIELLRIRYNQYNNIEQIIKNTIDS